MSSTRKHLTVALLGAATIAGVLLPAATAEAAPAPRPHVVQKEASGSAHAGHAALTVAAQINEIVGDAVEQKQNRAGYVKSLAEGAFYAANQQYNVAVIRYHNKYDADFNGAIYDQTVSAKGYPAFRVVVFKDGTLINRGDGGYQNWTLKGWFDRNGGSVTFRKP